MNVLTTFEDQISRLRIIATLDSKGRTALLDVLHDPRFSNLSKDSKSLFVELTNNHKTNLDKLLKKGVLKQEQWNLLFPINQETDSTKFDLTLYKLLIMICTNLPPPSDGWKKPLDANDVSIAAFVVRIIQLRNQIMHAPNSALTPAEFDNYWNDLEINLKGLGYNKSIAYMKSLPFEALGQDTIKACFLLSREIAESSKQTMEAIAESNKQHLEKNTESWKKYQHHHQLTKCLVLFMMFMVFIVVSVVGYSLNRKQSFELIDENHVANEASDYLRSHYMKSIENLNLPSIRKHYRLKKRFYIEPLVVEVRGMSDDLTHTESTMQQRGDISFQSLLDSYQHDVLLLQGAGGMGKTFIMENTALQWARKEIWKDVDFLFLLKFRNLFKYRSFEEALNHLFQIVFKKYSFDNLKKTNKQIVFLLDGLDEFVSFNTTNVDHTTCNDSSVLSGIYALLNPHCMVFPHTTIVISGRPSACQQLRSSLKMLFIPTFEVIGFSFDQVTKYIHLYFTNQTDSKSLIKIINRSESLLRMSKVPAFLWSLCELYQENEKLKDITTMTELYVLQLTIFLKRHLQLLSNHTLVATHGVEIYKLPQIQHIVFSLAKIASSMLENGTTIVYAARISSDIHIKQLEQSGIIIKLEASDQIQFHHTSTQEFLAAIHYHQTVENVYEFFSTSNLTGCFPFFAGLRGASTSRSKSPKVVVNFVQTLGGVSSFNNNERLTVADIAMQLNRTDWTNILFEYHNKLRQPSISHAMRNDLCLKIAKLPYNLDHDFAKCVSFRLEECKDIKNFNEFAKKLVSHVKLRNDKSLENLNRSSYMLGYYDDIFKMQSALCYHWLKVIMSPYDKILRYRISVLLPSFCINIFNDKFNIADINSTCQSYADSFGFCGKFLISTKRMQTDYANLVEVANQLKNWYKTCKSVNDYGNLYLFRGSSVSQSHLVYFFKHYGKVFRKNITHLQSKTPLSNTEVNIIKEYVCDIQQLYLQRLYLYEKDQLETLVTAIINCPKRFPSSTRLSKVLIDFNPRENFKTIGTIELLLQNIHTIEHPIIRVVFNSLRLFNILANTISRQIYSNESKIKYLTIYLASFTLLHCRRLMDFICVLEEVEIIPFNKYVFNNDTVTACWKMLCSKVTNTTLRYVTLGNFHLNRNFISELGQYIYRYSYSATNAEYSEYLESEIAYITLCQVICSNIAISVPVGIYYITHEKVNYGIACFVYIFLIAINITCLIFLYIYYFLIEGCTFNQYILNIILKLYILFKGN